ncbi:MAG TPA: prolyl oligopeptidase family serine peptidase [Opitutaceae bacterium]
MRSFTRLMSATMAAALPLIAPAQSGYQKPSDVLAAIVDAPATPTISISPDRTRMAILARAERPDIAELAQPELRIAGLRINPAVDGPSRAITFNGLSFTALANGASTRVTGLPEAPRILTAAWSSDSKHVAFTLQRDASIELWIAEAGNARARRLADLPVNATLTDGFAWMDASTLLVTRVPSDRGAAPVEPRTPSGPILQENSGPPAPAPTYQDLLGSPHDEALFDHHAMAELVLVGVDGKVTPFGPRGVIGSVSPSPDGRFVLVSTILRPYSYLVPVGRFAMRTQVFDRAGKFIKTVADLPLAENVSIASGSVRTGPRGLAWRADAGATLSWVEAIDGGDGGKAAEWRDAWFTLAAPFDGTPARHQQFALRVTSVAWGDANRALVTEAWTRTRRTRTWLVNPSTPGTNGVALFDRSSEDRYSDPGTPVLARNAFGRLSLQFSPDGGKIYLSGAGASAEGDQPFLDEMDLASKQTRRLWRSQAPWFENFVSFLDASATRALLRRESVENPPNYFTRDLASGALTAVTAFPHPHPQFNEVKRELIKYTRADGVALNGNLYLPPGYDAKRDGPRPTLLWAYPREFKSADAAGQVRESPYRFTPVAPTGPLPFLLAGYVVLDDPAMPIIGEGDKEPNDTYVVQLVSSAQAAVDELVKRGVTDPNRVAVGGHSYGAFMTANLLAHSRIFRAGIARSGAYNRTLTPFGFQAEDRSFWEAPEVYGAMSPFYHAPNIKDPILLIHGEADNNTGTYPIQSERFYAALKGHGATARLVMLPHESHGYTARESLLHMLYEEESWLEKHVKNAPVPAR